MFSKTWLKTAHLGNNKIQNSCKKWTNKKKEKGLRQDCKTNGQNGHICKSKKYLERVCKECINFSVNVDQMNNQRESPFRIPVESDNRKNLLIVCARMKKKECCKKMKPKTYVMIFLEDFITSKESDHESQNMNSQGVEIPAQEGLEGDGSEGKEGLGEKG